MKHCNPCKFFTVFLLSTLFLIAAGGTQNKSQSDIVEKWDDFSEEKIDTAPQQLSNIVIFRSEALQGTAINIYIDSEYHTSLLPGAYTQTTVCPGRHHIKPAYTNVQTRYKEKQMQGKTIALEPGKVYYFQVFNNGQNGLEVKGLTQAQSAALFKKYIPKQNHTISRLNKQECPKINNKNFKK